MEEREGGRLIKQLWAHVVQPEYTVRYSWTDGDLVMMDNRSTCHVAPTDHLSTDWDHQLYRVTLCGQPLRGPDGVESVSLTGEPIYPVEEELAQWVAAGLIEEAEPQATSY